VTTHDLIGIIKEVPWFFWLVLVAAMLSWLQRNWEHRARQGTEREAEAWPVVDGMVQGINVNTHLHEVDQVSSYEAVLTYSYSVLEKAETEYYSGRYSRTFNDEGLAWDWVRTMQDKRIRVHVRPDRPKESAVLTADLEAHFPMPQPFSEMPGLAGASGPPSLPGELRGPTEMAAWFAAVGFCLSLLDHLWRLLAGHPLHPRLSLILWIAFGVVAVPFGLWYQTRAGQSIFGKPKEWARVPGLVAHLHLCAEPLCRIILADRSGAIIQRFSRALGCATPGTGVQRHLSRSPVRRRSRYPLQQA
jgi:hypothetical protein